MSSPERFKLNWEVLVVAACLVLTASPSRAESFFDQFKDKQDGWIDASDWVLDNEIGFLPVPVIITEPAVGQGLGVAAVFFHAPDDYSEGKNAESNQVTDNELPELDGGDNDQDNADDPTDFVLPDVSALVAAGTNNDSWLVGGGHFAHWKDDTIRYNGVAGYASMNLTFYGLAGLPASSKGLDFNGEGLFIGQDISWRVKESDFFLGTGYTFMQVEAEFDLGQILPGLPGIKDKSKQSGVEIFVSYDSVDTSFTPNTGMNAKIAITHNDESIGSDFDYDNLDAHLHKWWNPTKQWVIGLRFDVQNVDGDVPFYSVPYIDLRGIPAMRYQGETVGVTEGEVRWNFHPRISLVGFTGVGVAAQSTGDLSDEPSRATHGLGIRYNAARKLGLYSGIDVAQGPEETYWYLQVGSAWK